jgi:hypothetical protein
MEFKIRGSTVRVNSRVFEERTDMLDGIQIPNCSPKELRVVAERIMNMVTKLGYSVGDYNSVTELDKKITVDYWKEYDMLRDCIDGFVKFEVWYPKYATEAELISRARRWLVERNYLLLKEEVVKRSITASNNFRQAVRG